MYKYLLPLLLVGTLLAVPKANAQECFFLKNVLDTLYQINPSTGFLAASALTTDFPAQGYYGYLSTIDPIGRRYMFVTRLSNTSFDDFGLKVYDLDSQVFVTSVLLTDYQGANTSPGSFSFHGLEYGAIADELYVMPVTGDSLYQIDMVTGKMSGKQVVPGFQNTYSYLHTFNQSEQRYAMISTDASGQKRFFQVDLDDDTTYVSPPMNFQDPLRALEVSEVSGEYYVVSDVDQTVYTINPTTGALVPQFPIPGYQNAYFYLHTFDFASDAYMMVGMDTAQNVSLFTIYPATGAVFQVPFPVPALGYFGLEATNTQYLTKMVNDLTTSLSPEQESLSFNVFPNPVSDGLTFEWKEKEAFALEMFDPTGKMVYQQTHNAVSMVKVPVGDLASGRYLLRVNALGSGKQFAKWVVVE